MDSRVPVQSSRSMYRKVKSASHRWPAHHEGCEGWGGVGKGVRETLAHLDEGYRSRTLIASGLQVMRVLG